LGGTLLIRGGSRTGGGYSLASFPQRLLQ